MTDLDRLAQPLLEPGTGQIPAKARQLKIDRCDVRHARVLIARWHSRLPDTQTGPWMAAYRAAYDGTTYAVALWNTPSARTLPQGLLELRRMAVAADAPHCTASRFLNEMARRIRDEFPHVQRIISYQDTSVHTGTIYKAAGWTAAYTSTPRVRDRTGHRAGTRRMYRWNLNGAEPDAAAKTRWEYDIRPLLVLEPVASWNDSKDGTSRSS
jgi:hypothetical protein